MNTTEEFTVEAEVTEDAHIRLRVILGETSATLVFPQGVARDDAAYERFVALVDGFPTIVNTALHQLPQEMEKQVSREEAAIARMEAYFADSGDAS